MIKITFIFLLILFAVVFSPLISIWSLNTIFTTNIAYTFETWAATVWLTILIFGRISMKTNEK